MRTVPSAAPMSTRGRGKFRDHVVGPQGEAEGVGNAPEEDIQILWCITRG